jgi:cation transport regulator
VPYATRGDLPPAVRRLPPQAQEIFRSAFNNAWETYADRGSRRQEATAFRVAWAAVKHEYEKIGPTWVRKVS